MGITRILSTYFSTCLTPQLESHPARPTSVMMKRIDNLFPGDMDDMSICASGLDVYNAWCGVVDWELNDDGEIVSTRSGCSRRWHA